ncbi:methyltransferase domain-containing protein [Phenylobacterium sp. 20VBR1]|uniref:Methyltransferase domain-containing protein n=1 Tax=Phenylobacterium glaciei TaxID=2803784 RepID=A0A941D557_9CAUL|nr:methyltransferase domain-containing protein [Phenylobacterium glaciei]MBR7620983.1 methyltransferase domain-containing protein [Phenylobacterium glaciei]QQZ49712.1 methyltransferase domain-containing protein [Phenylobacterium glaciei]
MSPFPQLPPDAFAKQDDGDDAEFYAEARLKTHIDDAAIAALTDFYRLVLPAGGALLDLMSSWVSHLPPEVAYGEVIGHGMNADEMAANRRLSRWFIQDLNRTPVLDLADASLDGAMICVGVQYLQQPQAVLAEVARSLRPGAPLVVSYSNRCFPTKAVAIWRDIGPQGHARLIELYLEAAGFSGIEVHRLRDGRASDPLTVVLGRAP